MRLGIAPFRGAPLPSISCKLAEPVLGLTWLVFETCRGELSFALASRLFFFSPKPRNNNEHHTFGAERRPGSSMARSASSRQVGGTDLRPNPRLEAQFRERSFGVGKQRQVNHDIWLRGGPEVGQGGPRRRATPARRLVVRNPMLETPFRKLFIFPWCLDGRAFHLSERRGSIILKVVSTLVRL